MANPNEANPVEAKPVDGTKVLLGGYKAKQDGKYAKTGEFVQCLELYGLQGWRNISLPLNHTDFKAVAATLRYWAGVCDSVGDKANALANSRVEVNKAKSEHQSLLILAQKYPEMQPRIKASEERVTALEAEAIAREKAIMG